VAGGNDVFLVMALARKIVAPSRTISPNDVSLQLLAFRSLHCPIATSSPTFSNPSLCALEPNLKMQAQNNRILATAPVQPSLLHQVGMAGGAAVITVTFIHPIDVIKVSLM
jgi:hypothetical protein